MPTEEKGNGAQQETNSALAALAKAGNTFALGQLWEINKGLARRVYWQWYQKHTDLAAQHGLTVDDFEQESYFAVKRAAESYDPERGAFSTYLANMMRYHICTVMHGEHARNISDKEGKVHTISANPLNMSCSLDEPLLDGDGGEADTRLVDMVEDKTAGAALMGVEDRLYNEQLHTMLDTALDKLPANEARCIRARYFEGLTMKEAGAAQGVSTSRAGQLETAGLRRLRMNPAVAYWRVSYKEQRANMAWGSSGLGAWQSSGSVEERTVERLERKGAYVIEHEKFDFEAERAQMQEYFAEKEKQFTETMAAAMGVTPERFLEIMEARRVEREKNA